MKAYENDSGIARVYRNSDVYHSAGSSQYPLLGEVQEKNSLPLRLPRWYCALTFGKQLAIFMEGGKLAYSNLDVLQSISAHASE